MRSSMPLPCALLLLLLASPLLRAQTTGSLVGTVTDNTGKKVSGATVVVLGTTPTRGGIAKSDGSYMVVGIRAGEYDVRPPPSVIPV